MAKRAGPVEVVPVEAEIDRLYQGSLNEFTGGRNALAARLKAAGRPDDAERIRALAKPGLPSWAVNQVYWHARDLFDQLLRAGDRLREAQLAGLKGTSADVAQAALARQQAIDAVVDRAMRFVTEAGSSASSTTQQRVAVTADAIAAHGTLPNRPPAGRLAGDLDPPGFGLLAALVPGTERERVTGAQGHRDIGARTGAEGHRGDDRGTGDRGTGAEGHSGTGAKTAAQGHPPPHDALRRASRGTGQSALPHEPSRGREPAGKQEPWDEARTRRDAARERHEALERARFEAARADGELRRRRGEQERAAREVERAAARLASAEDAERKAREALAAAGRAVTEARAAHGDAASRASEARNATAEAEREAGEAKRQLKALE